MTMQPDPQVAPDEVMGGAAERDVLETFLDLYRAIVARRLSGVPEDDARRTRVRGFPRVAARFRLDDLVPHPRMGSVSLRWIYVHMLEETARHAGHADILREEQIDGAVGFDG